MRTRSTNSARSCSAQLDPQYLQISLKQLQLLHVKLRNVGEVIIRSVHLLATNTSTSTSSISSQCTKLQTHEPVSCDLHAHLPYLPKTTPNQVIYLFTSNLSLSSNDYPTLDLEQQHVSKTELDSFFVLFILFYFIFEMFDLVCFFFKCVAFDTSNKRIEGSFTWCTSAMIHLWYSGDIGLLHGSYPGYADVLLLWNGHHCNYGCQLVKAACDGSACNWIAEVFILKILQAGAVNV